MAIVLALSKETQSARDQFAARRQQHLLDRERFGLPVVPQVGVAQLLSGVSSWVDAIDKTLNKARYYTSQNEIANACTHHYELTTWITYIPLQLTRRRRQSFLR